MRRREVLTLIAGAGAWPLQARAQHAGKVARIGYLAPGSHDNPLVRQNLDAFLWGLRDLGHVEGQNIIIEYRFAEGDFGRLPDLAAELVRLEVAVIVAAPTPAAVAARNATGTIPIVMINVGDPVGLGLITSLSRPGGNITGSSFTVGTDTFGKALELLRDAVPSLRSVAVLSNPANPSHALVTRDVEVAARALGVQVQSFEIRGPDEFDSAFAAMTKERVEALYVVADVQFVLHAARLAELAIKSRLPSMHQLRRVVEAGGLMSYGHNAAEQWRSAAAFVDKLLKGAKPADLPVEQPTKFELVINLKTARALGLEIPPTLLARADEVIE
jgi:putative tryptophan/tyrosine transport system substrate-binding protein